MTQPRTHAAALPMTVLAAAGFLSSAGARIIDPLMEPVSHSFRVGVPSVALVLIAFTVPYGALQLVVGPLADRVGKLSVLVIALSAYAIANALCAVAPSLPLLIASRICAGAASAGLIPVCMAFLADQTPYAERQAVLCRFLTGVVIANMLSGPLGGVFGEFITWRGVFALLSGCAVVLALWIRRYARHSPANPGPMEKRRYSDLLQPGLRCFMLSVFANGILFGGAFPFMAPLLTTRFHMSYAGAGLILAFFGLGALMFVRQPKLFQAYLGERGLVLMGGITAAAGLMLGLLGHHWWLFPVVEVMLGFGYFALHSVVQARATELLPAARGTATSGFVFVLFMGSATGAGLGGALVAFKGYLTLFWLDAAGILGLSWWLSFLVSDMALQARCRPLNVRRV